MSTDNSSNRPSVRDIFFHALDKQTPDEREAYLEGACGQDTALRAKVDALLKSHQADSFLERPAVDLSKTTVTPASELTEGSGTLIGRYKLLQQLGEGGMGVVYMAEQTEPVTRKVALKIIKLGMDTKQVVARFEAERQQKSLREAVETERGRAQDAQNAAEKKRQRAEEQRERADRERLTSQRNAYVANMFLVQRAWEQNNVVRMRQLLEETAAYPERNFEWYYWQRQTRAELKGPVKQTFGSSSSSVDFSPDGQKIVTGSFDQTVKVWEVAGGKQVLTKEWRGLFLQS